MCLIQKLSINKYYLSLFLLFLSGVNSIFAQNVSDFSVRVEATPSTCVQNGRVKIIVAKTPGAPTYPYRVYYDLLDSKNVSVTNTGTYVDNQVIGNLRPGTYKTNLKVENTSNGVSIQLAPVTAVITSSYKVPSLKLNVERKSLNNYRPSGSGEAVSTGIISATVQGGTAPYTLTILEAPVSTLKGSSFILEQNKPIFLYNLKKGTYKIKVTDACGDLPVQSIEMSNVASDLPRNSFSALYFNSSMEKTEDMRKKYCDWIRLVYNNYSGNPISELTPYFGMSIDTLAKYYDYAWQTPAETKKKVARSYHSFFSQAPFGNTTHGSDKEAIYYKLPSNVTFQEIAQKELYWPALFVKVKGSSEEMPAGYTPSHYGYTSLFIERRLKETDPCTPYILEVRSERSRSRLMCYPIEVKVESSNKADTQILSFDQETDYVSFPHPLDRNKTYTITTKDARGDIRKEILKPNYYGMSISSDKDFCLGKLKDRFLLYAYRYTGTNSSSSFPNDWRGYKIFFKSAPPSFEPAEGAIQVGEVYEIPQDPKMSSLSALQILAPKNQLADTYYLNPPAGKYEFELTDKCGGKFPVSINYTPERVPKYTADESVFRPKIVKIECGRVRIYPFANTYEGLLKKDGVSIEPFFKLDKLPSSIKYDDVRTNIPSDSYTWSGNRVFTTQYKDKGLLNPAEIYLDFPITEGYIELALRMGTSYDFLRKDRIVDNLVCMPTFSIPLQNLPLTYDRDTYIGYSCPSGLSGELHITPINNVGNTTVELREMDGTHIETKTVPKGTVATFKLKGTTSKPIPTQYRAVIKDLDCQNTSNEVLTIYSLASPSVIRSKNQQRKFCEGDSIELDVINLGALKYTWIFPNGSHREGKKLVIPSATSEDSGIYRLVISSLTCGDEQTNVEIPFTISVAPTELWWKYDAEDANWHNPNNWALTSGESVSSVPSHCTVVHIPASVQHAYPDLGGGTTTRDIFGAPECSDIFFHYGSQLGNPQELSYQRAHIDYNFGEMTPSGEPIPLVLYGHPRANEKMLARDRWYMLSTPLRNTVSGDFGLAGSPRTYQRFLSEQVAGSLTDLSFNDPFPSLVASLTSAEYRNALALKVAGAGEGAVDYLSNKHLNALLGIIQLPFFEIHSEDYAYPLHTFDAVSRRSTFRYFDEKTLEPMALCDAVSRGDGVYSYRFVYEKYNSSSPGASTIGTVNDRGRIVPGYSMALGVLKTDQFFMVGNPFMTPINFDKLSDVNENTIYPYYYIFENNTWKVYSREIGSVSALGKGVAPLQAVVLRYKNRGSADLLFPTSGERNVLMPSWKSSLGIAPIHVQIEKELQKEISSILKIRVENHKKESSEVFLGWTLGGESAPALSNREYSTVPTLFITNPDTSESNAICFPKRNVGSLDLGLYADLSGEMTLSFDNIDLALYKELILEDRETGRHQNILEQSTYHFIHKPSVGLKRFRLRLKRYGVSNEVEERYEAFAPSLRKEQGVLYLSANYPMSSISLYDMNGAQVYTYQGKSLSQHEIAVEKWYNKVILVEVRSYSGECWVQKLHL